MVAPNDFDERLFSILIDEDQSLVISLEMQFKDAFNYLSARES